MPGHLLTSAYSTPWRRQLPRGTLLFAVVLALPQLLGCDLSHPPGAYDGGPLPDDDLASTTGTMANPPPDGDIPPPPDTGGPSTTGTGGPTTAGEGGQPPGDGGQEQPSSGTGGPGPEVDAGGGDAPQADPLAAVQGDYYLRFYTRNVSSDDSLGQVTSETTTYGLMRLLLQEGQLVGFEKLCDAKTEQQATMGEINSSVSTAAWQNLEPVKRPFQVDLASGTFSTGFGVRRQGWEGEGTAMPTTSDSPQLNDPDGDGINGVATRIWGVTDRGTEVDCVYHMVSYAETRYADGQLNESGLPVRADVKVNTSDAHALASEGGALSCSTRRVNTAARPMSPEEDVVQFKRHPNTESNDLACPGLSLSQWEQEFQ